MALTCESYSEKSVVVRGTDTKSYINELKEIGGKWNAGLKGGGGWIFPSKNLDKIKLLISKSEKNPKSSSPDTSKNVSFKGPDMKDYVTKKEFLALSTEVEKLRAIVENLTGTKIPKADQTVDVKMVKKSETKKDVVPDSKKKTAEPKNSKESESDSDDEVVDSKKRMSGKPK